MAFTAQQIADYYKQTVGTGQMTEAQFVDLARQHNISDSSLQDARNQILYPQPTQSLANQISTAQQGVIGSSGYTADQLSAAGRGEGSPGFMQNDPNYMQQKQLNDQMMIAGNMAGRSAAPEGTQFRSTAVFNPKTNLIELRDQNGTMLTGIQPGTTGSNFGSLDRLGVDPSAYQSAVNAYLGQNPANADYIRNMASQYQPRYGGAPDPTLLRSGIDPTQDASAFFANNQRPDIKTFMDRAGVDFRTASSMLSSHGLGSAADALVDWQKVMSSPDPARSLNAAYAAIGTNPQMSQWASQAVGQDYRGWNMDGKPVSGAATGAQGGGFAGGSSNLGMGGGMGGMGGMGGGGSFGFGSSSSSSGQQGLNPFQPEMFNAVTQQVTDNLNRNILPGVRSAATATGGYGGSRQGVVEANAMKDANQGLSNALGTIQYGDWNNYQNRLLQNKGMDQSYNLGLGNLNLGFQNSNQNFYTQQRGQDLQQVGLGASIYNMGTQGMLGQGQGIYNLGLTAQQAPWQTLTGFNNVSSPYTGYGSTSGTQAGSPLANAAGGAMLGGQMYQAWKGNAGTPTTGANMSYAPGMQPTNAMSYF